MEERLGYEIFAYLKILRESPNIFKKFLKSRSKFFVCSKKDSVHKEKKEFKIIYKINGKVPVKTKEGVLGVEETIKYLDDYIKITKTKPQIKEKLEFSVGLSLAAKEFVKKIPKECGKFHNIKETLRNRIQEYGSFGKHNFVASECLIFKLSNPQNIILSLLIDDGNPERKNRKLLLDRRFNKVGIGICKNHELFGTVCCLEFAQNYQTFEKYANTLPSPFERSETVDILNQKTYNLDDLERLNAVEVSQKNILAFKRKGNMLGNRNNNQGMSYQFKKAKQEDFKLFSPRTKLLFEGRAYSFVFSFGKPSKSSEKETIDISLCNNDIFYEVYQFNSKRSTIFHLKIKNLQKGVLVILKNGLVLHKFKVE